MKNSILIPEKFEHIFMIEARKCGLIKRDSSFSEFDDWEEELFSKYFQARQKLFQLILLYDELIIPAFDPTYEYSKLNDLGCFSIYSFDDFYYFDPIHEEGHLEFAEYLKPAILPVISKELKKFFPIGDGKTSFKKMSSYLYDVTLGLKKDLDGKVEYVIETNKIYFDIRYHKNIMKMKSLNAPLELTEKRFYTEIVNIIRFHYERLCWQLEISSKKDSYIINSNYQLTKVGCSIYEKDINTYLESYKILKCECSKIIGILPKMNNLNDVFELKEKRRNDIKNLKEVLCNLEDVLKKEGKQQAIIRASDDVNKAAKALSKGNELSTVGKWTTLFSVPVGVAELLYSLPPVGFALTIAGASVCIVEEIIKSKSRWCEIVR